MSNYTEITLDGKVVGLRFGMIAYEEFRRLLQTREVESVGGTLVTADIIYSGAYNDAVLKGKKVPKYEILVDAIDELYDTEEGLTQINDVYQFFNESRFGRKLFATAAEEKKKLAELNELNQPIGTQLESSPTPD